MPISPSEPLINYIEIIKHISDEITFVWQELAGSDNEEVKESVKSIKQITVVDEQLFRKQETNNALVRGTVYLVVRFGSGATNFASSVTPISIQGLGVANQVKPVQLLLSTFASYWTTKNMSQGLGSNKEADDMLQLWNTPEVVSNFNVLDTDFRNLYKITGSIVVGPAAIRVGTLTYYYGDNYRQSETVNIMAFKDNHHAAIDPQPFGDTNNFAKSETNFVTYVFTISTYLLNSQLARDVLAIRGFRYRPNGEYSTASGKSSKLDSNDSVKVEIKFTNDFNNMPGPNETRSDNDLVKGDDFYTFYKIIDSGITQEIGSIPTLTVTFAR